MISVDKIRNIAIIAHVDHGKTTLVDQLLKQSGTLGTRAQPVERIMDSNDLEKERGITILAKNASINYLDYKINFVDTPGHADFGGEVERILSMVDSVLLLVDAVEGPMPQTRFVTKKAFAMGLSPIVVINKIDRPGARPEWVINQIFELFDRLGATEQQLDFPIIYSSALHGYADLDLNKILSDLSQNNINNLNMTPLFKLIIEKVSPPHVELNAPLQLQITSLDYSSYVGAIGIGRIKRGVINANQSVLIINALGDQRRGKILQVLTHIGLEKQPVDKAIAGDIVAITGLENLKISDTICDVNTPEALSALTVDEPTVSITLQVNTSPFAGQDGTYVTSRQIAERLERELIHNVALKVELTESSEKFKLSGRGELHLSILLETMRREGYEFAVSRPEVIIKTINNQLCEPYELLTIDVDQNYQGELIEKLALRKGELINLETDNKNRTRLEYMIPSRGLIGFHTECLTISSGTALMHHVFDHYDVIKPGDIEHRKNGALISNNTGKATPYAIFNLQPRGRLCIDPQTVVYEGMIVGFHNRENDLVVNATREKQLTNIRAAGSDENVILSRPLKFSLEQALEIIQDDELVEITPKSIRLRKKYLKESDRKRNS